MIYHITSLTDWEQALEVGQYTAASLNHEGFIHASNREQVTDTANLYYRGQTGLVLLEIDPSRLAAELRYEQGTGHTEPQLFPHLYGPLNLDAVMQVLPFDPQPDGTFCFPGS